MSAAIKEPKTWSKAEEVEFLDQVIQKLGARSYLGPWLAENRNQIVADIGNDVPMELETPYKAYRRGLDIIAEAHKEAAIIIEQAHAKALGEIDATRSRIAEQRAHARRELEAAAGRL